MPEDDGSEIDTEAGMNQIASGAHLLSLQDFKRRKSAVLDQGAAYAVEIGSLNSVVNNAMTRTGSALVGYSLCNPSTDLETIQAKQKALQEIASNGKLRQGIVNLLERVRDHEKRSIDFLKTSVYYSGDHNYDNLPVLREMLVELPQWAEEIPEPETAYLKKFKRDIMELKGQPVQKLAKGPIYRQLFRKGVFHFGELRPHLPTGMFNYSPLKVTRIAPSVAVGASPLIYLLYQQAHNVKIPEHDAMPLTMFGMVGIAIGFKAGEMLGKRHDMLHFFNPLQERFNGDPNVRAAFYAVGALDEVVSHDQFRKKLGHATLPKVTDADRHYFRAKGLINAVQSQKTKPYVPNNILVGDGKGLTFITGPNSGGKTSLSKSIAQAQVLAQAGCYVPADSAEMAIADRIFYQVGQNDSLDDSEGGFGTQLADSRKIFVASTPKTLVVIDDLIEGTTFEEKTQQTTDALCGFVHVGADVIYVSHHHELAKWFRDQGVGRYYQVQFNGHRPTHKITTGISTNSHADAVARRVGYSGEDIRRHLVKEGYLPGSVGLRDLSRHNR